MTRMYLKILTVCALLLSPAMVMAQSSSQKIMDAVMKVYADELKKNPNDYAVLYSRANQYYVNGEYKKALDDINAALRVTTRGDMTMLVDEYMLRAKIYNATGKSDLALNDLQEANKLNPSSEVVVTMLADTYYRNGDYTNSRQCYLNLYRRSNINYVAILGLARNEVKLNNFGQAEEYANQAVELYPAEPAVYIGRAEVFQMLGRNREAANDLIMAVSITDGGPALTRLLNLSDTAYGDVVAALDAAIQRAPASGMFYYIKSSVQINHYHYADGLHTLEEIINKNMYDYHSIYYEASVAAFNLCRYDEALKYINMAIEQQGLSYYFVQKAQVLSAKGNIDEAYEAIREGLIANPNDVEVLYEKAMLDIDAGEYRMALQGFNEIMMITPTWSQALYMRGWLQKNHLNDEKSARNDFDEVLLSGENDELVRGFVLHQLGRDNEAAKWCETITKNLTRAGGQAYYVASVLMSQMGNADASIDYLSKALTLGYGSYYDITANEAPLNSLQAVRHLDKFKETVSARQSLFE